MAKPSLESFDHGDFAEYLERVKFYFIANDIGSTPASASAAEKSRADTKKAAYLVSFLSKSAYSTLKTLCLPDSPSDKKYEELCKLLKSYFKVVKSRTTATFDFRQTTQSLTESVTDYSHRLKRSAADCQFGDFLDRALRDQFVAGVRSNVIKRKLLTTPETQITCFDDILKIATTEEKANQFLRELNSAGAPDESIKHLKSGPRHGDSKKFAKTKKSSPAATASNHPTTKSSNSTRSCYRCGEAGHLANKCYHVKTVCNFCNKMGHIERVCLTKTRGRQCHHLSTTDPVRESTGDDFSDSGENDVHMFLLRDVRHSTSASTTNPPYLVSVNVCDVPVTMEIDTGTGVSVLSTADFKKLRNAELKKPTVVLRGFSGRIIDCQGECVLPVSVNNQTKNVTLRVVSTGPSLLGRDLLETFTLPWNDIRHTPVHKVDHAANLASEFPTLFDDSTLGKLNSTQVKINVDFSRPVYLKSRVVPFSIQEQYDATLDKLEREGVIRKVEQSDWASPTVPVRKPDGSIRICADYSSTLNKASKLEQHPLPTIEEMMTKLSGGQKFTKLDLSQAYHQLELSPESRPYTTINTHRGLYEYLRLPFGINSAVSIFQRTIENILADLPGCVVYIDDILVTGKDDAEHMANLRQVLQRLQDAGLKLKHEKCKWLQDEVTYLGHTITARGISPGEAKVQDLKKAKAPTNVGELQSFIGSANYLRKFIPNFAQKMSPLYDLLKRESTWRWGDLEEKAFGDLKSVLSSTDVLAHYSLSEELILQTDASGQGLGAVMLQPDSQGDLCPIAYASRVLGPSEKNYSQIEREALSIVFGVQKFRQYLLGRHFKLNTDHKPLVSLFNPHSPVPMLTSSRLKKWKLVLAAYDYSISHIPGKCNVIADYLSRSSVDGSPSAAEEVVVEVLLLDTDGVVNADAIAAETKKDSVLSEVLNFTKHGWPTTVTDPDLRLFCNRQTEISLQDGILLWNSRVLVPESLRAILLHDLHAEHLGIVRMKRLARLYMWWPKLDADIEEVVKLCPHCQINAKKPPKTHGTWQWPAGPWKRLHIDFAGPFLGKMFLVIVDAHSKFLEIIPMSVATSTSTISALRRLFALFGLPEHLVSDNGSQFTSDEFRKFLLQNGIHHTLTAPGHPATNGLAERYVGHFKSSLKALSTDDSNGDLQSKLQRFLFSYRATPSSTGKSPSEMLMQRQMRTRFDNLKPSTTKQQLRVYEQNLDNTPVFSVGQPVYTLNFSKYGEKWVPGVVTDVHSPMNYQVQVDEASWKRHRNQLRPRTLPESLVRTPTQSVTSNVSMPVPAEVSPASSTLQERASPSTDGNVAASVTPSPEGTASASPPERQKRNIRLPARYRD